jgi:hypothetical protein
MSLATAVKAPGTKNFAMHMFAIEKPDVCILAYRTYPVASLLYAQLHAWFLE